MKKPANTFEDLILRQKSTDSVVCIVTGGGLKYTAALAEHQFDVKKIGIDRIERVI